MLGRAAVAVSFAPSPEGKESKEPSLPRSLAKSPHRLLSGRAHLQPPATSQWQPSPGSHNRQDCIPHLPMPSETRSPPPLSLRAKNLESDIKSFNGLVLHRPLRPLLSVHRHVRRRPVACRSFGGKLFPDPAVSSHLSIRRFPPMPIPHLHIVSR